MKTCLFAQKTPATTANCDAARPNVVILAKINVIKQISEQVN